ncbi:hypothetical protein [Actinoplanes sp. N902-109]|uniref:hypothetical protein n=1 Tax=Actinoplanes sp. (strain N902-109) TaxID=649831 RepID=UPI0003295048|nr:hypothetical protein [Actinoplanes sp. N902-109]AGL21518.1 hypothetical protein L083_8008 [Actinoplanes sp. N902-109]
MDASGLYWWPAASPIFRRGRLQPSVVRWPAHVFEESDYCYGIGPLSLRLHRVEWDKPIPYEGDTWLEVEGTVIDPRTGEPGPTRQVLVRAGTLPAPPTRKRPRLRP